MKAKENHQTGEDVLAEDTNQSAENANRGGGFDGAQVAGATFAGATTPVPFYIDAGDDNKLKALDADDQAKIEFSGFVISDGDDDDPVDTQSSGVVRGFTGLTPGARYYAQDTAGTIGTTPGTYEVLVGIAVSETELLILKGSSEYIGTASFAGGSSSTTGFTRTVSIPASARFAVCIVNGSADPGAINHEIMIFRKGATSATERIAFSTDYYTTVISLSGDTITLTVSSNTQNSSWSGGGTAYFYK